MYVFQTTFNSVIFSRIFSRLFVLFFILLHRDTTIDVHNLTKQSVIFFINSKVPHYFVTSGMNLMGRSLASRRILGGGHLILFCIFDKIILLGEELNIVERGLFLRCTCLMSAIFFRCLIKLVFAWNSSIVISSNY